MAAGTHGIIYSMNHKYQLKEDSTQPGICALEQAFGSAVRDQDTLYAATDADLCKAYSILNTVAFDSKLPADFPIILEDLTDDVDAKGVVMRKVSDNKPAAIKFYRDSSSDIMLDMISVLAHEMIHLYDALYGPAKKFMGEAFTKSNGRQYLGTYDAHGRFFNRQIRRLADLGIPVEEHYHPGSKYFIDSNDLARFINRKEPMTEAIIPSDATPELHAQIAKHQKVVDQALAFYHNFKTDGFLAVEVDNNDEVYIVYD